MHNVNPDLGSSFRSMICGADPTYRSEREARRYTCQRDRYPGEFFSGLRVHKRWWPTRSRTSRAVAPVTATHRERAGRVKGAQRRSGPLTRPSPPGKFGTGAAANQDAIHSWKAGHNTSGRIATETKPLLLFVLGRSRLTFVRSLGQHSHRRTHARPSTSMTLTSGRERPRRSALGPRSRDAGGVAHAPSLLRDLCWGAYRAAQTAALVARPDQHQHRLRQWIAAPP